MSFADCALMGPLYGHFFVDLESRRLLLDSAWRVVGWIDRCNAPNPDHQGEWLTGDALAPELLRVLEVMGQDAAPVILDVVRTCEDWVDANREGLDVLPRAAGGCESTLRGMKFKRGAFPYALWSIQRIHAVWRSLSASERESVSCVLAGTGWEDVIAHVPRQRLARRGFDLVLEPS